MKHTHVHVVGAGETLRLLAQRYGLDSWRAIYDAPGNAALRRNFPEPDDVPPGLTITVPRPVQQLLRQRLQALYRIKPFLAGLFDEQDRLLESLSAGGLSDADFADATSLAPLLREINDAVAAAIEDSAAAATAIADTNLALLQTHWYCSSDLAAIPASGGVEAAGLYWLVSLDLVAVWRQLWSAERLLARHRELDGEPAARWMARELTTVRSRVLQHADSRIRQTLVAIAGFDRQRASQRAD